MGAQPSVIQLNAVVKTRGDGRFLNSPVKKDVLVRYIQLKGSRAQVYFDTSTWSVDKGGLLYTDTGFERQLKRLLRTRLGFTPRALRALQYSEQGLQGVDYVDFDANAAFLLAWREQMSAKRAL